jgi:phenylacetate-coenzyme A ligase PaaK-like adenylate-forming protein
MLPMFFSKNNNQKEIVLSTIKNKGMPLIRYKTGDYGILDTSQCTCGNITPKITGLIGKTIPCLWMTDGTAFEPSRLNRIIFMNPYIKDYQLIYSKSGEISLNLYLERASEEKDEILSKLTSDFKQVCPNCSSVRFKIYDHLEQKVFTDRYIENK